MVVQYLLLLAGFVVLIKGADWLVKGSVSLAKKYHVSELVIGLTIVAFGTSAPELVVNIMASVTGLNDVTLGNVVGSNLFNVMLILGVSGIIFPLTVQIKTVWKEIPLSLVAVIILFFMANNGFRSGNDLLVSRMDGMGLLVCFILFMIYMFKSMKADEELTDSDYRQHKSLIAVLLVLLGLSALIAGSKLVVDNAVKLAQNAGISERIIGITILSAGTSLPELATSAVAALKKRSDIAIGNIIGSNIFNLFLIMGVSSVISPIKYNPDFNSDLILLMASTILLFIFMFSGKRYKLDRWEAGVFLVGYICYIILISR